MRKTIFVIFSLFVFACASCADPASTNSAADENSSLTGTWKHIAVSRTAGGERLPITRSEISWTFNADGTGSYTQIVKDDKESASNGTSDFKWSRTGDEILMIPVKTGRELNYTIAGRSADEMVWKTYINGDYYIVKKQ